MFKLESYKLFKGKIIQVVIAGIFLLIFAKEVFIHNTYKIYQPGIIISEKETGDLWQNFLMALNSDILLLPAFIVFSFAGIFSYENRYGMHEIILSTKNGRKKCTNAKFQIAFIITNLVYIVTVFIPIAHMFIMTKGAGNDKAIQATVILHDSTLKASYMELVLHMLFLSFIVINVVLLLTLFISFLSRNTFVSVCIILGILYIMRPDLLSMFFGVEKTWYIMSFGPVNAMNVLDIVRRPPVEIYGNTVHWIYVIEAIYIMILVCSIFIFNAIIVKRQKYYAS
ncbi:MAG: hypothetical protein HFH68_11540 [Lachnospiraceae bacterium]|nr:hypothetical protein [Lachnospiraceae bacterium]